MFVSICFEGVCIERSMAKIEKAEDDFFFFFVNSNISLGNAINYYKLFTKNILCL